MPLLAYGRIGCPIWQTRYRRIEDVGQSPLSHQFGGLDRRIGTQTGKRLRRFRRVGKGDPAPAEECIALCFCCGMRCERHTAARKILAPS